MIPKINTIQNDTSINGPNAILDFKFANLNNNSIADTKPPMINARSKLINPFSTPKNKPIGIASYTSPRPIPLPLVIKYRSKRGKGSKNAGNK